MFLPCLSAFVVRRYQSTVICLVAVPFSRLFGSVVGMTDDEVIGANVRARRLELGMNQTELGEKMQEAGLDSWNQKKVSRVEGGAEVNMRDLRTLEKVLGGVIEGTELGRRLRSMAKLTARAAARTSLAEARSALAETQDRLDNLAELLDIADDDEQR